MDKEDDVRNVSTDSTREVQIFKKRAELAEGSAKSSRDKANLLEDVSAEFLRQLFQRLIIANVECTPHGS